MKIKRNFWIVLFASFIAVSSGIYFQNTFLLRFAYLMILILLIGVIWTYLSLEGIQYKRTSRESRMECGQVFAESYELKNISKFPKLWLQIEDRSELPFQAASRLVTRIQPHQIRYFESLTVLTQRGEILLGPTEILSGDPFGFFQKSRSIPAVSKLVVLPLVLSLENLITRKGNLSGSKARRESFSEITPNAGGVRDFKPGDSFSRIHWKTSARKQSWMVKEFDQDPHSDIWLFLDADQKKHFRLGRALEPRILLPREAFHFDPQKILPSDSFEYSVSIAASLSSYFLLEGRGIGLICKGQQLITIPPERGERQRYKLLENLAYIQPQGDLAFSALIQSHSDMLVKGNSVILISATNDPELVLVTDQIIRKGIPVSFFRIDPRSFGNVETDDQFLGELDRKGIPFTSIHVDEDLEKAIQSQFWKFPVRTKYFL
jgi:uncharacterized protein (DUF58 family)